MARFLKECIVPVAIQTNAVIIVHSDVCTLSSALSDIVSSIAAQNGGRAPFSVINFNVAVAYHHQSEIPGTTAYALKMKSKRWRDSNDKIQSAVLNCWGEQEACWGKSDAPPSCTHYIMLDGVTGSNRHADWSALYSFKNAFIQSLAGSLPSIAVQALGWGAWSTVNSLSDYVSRGLPLLLLDCRPYDEY